MTRMKSPAARSMTAWRVTSLPKLLLMLAIGAFPGVAAAEPEAVPGEGRELFIARCSICHSIDYVEMHARFGTRALWEASVAKMRNAFKAPITEDEVPQLVDYLERNYGPAGVAGPAGAADPARVQRTMPSGATSKTRVAPGSIAGGEPRSP